MAWVLVAVTAVLALLVVALAAVVLRLRGRLAVLESRVGAGPATVDTPRPPVAAADADGAEERPTGGYVITRVGEPDDPGEPRDAVPTVPAPVFADLVLKETVVQTASLVQGLRRALAPETRNRIRFHVRQEVKRSRKQRRADLRELRREWAARQRDAVRAERAAAAGPDTAAAQDTAA